MALEGPIIRSFNKSALAAYVPSSPQCYEKPKLMVCP